MTIHVPGDGTSNNPEDSEVIQSSDQYTASDLVKTSIGEYFGNPIDPELYEAYISDPNRQFENIKNTIENVRMNNPLYKRISDGEINGETTDTKLARYIADHARELVYKRRSLKNRIIDIFPDIKKEANWNKKLTENISRLTHDEINLYLYNKGKLRSWIVGIFPMLKDSHPRERKRYEEIFYDIESITSVESEKLRLLKIVAKKDRDNESPDTGDIRFVLSVYQNANHNRIREIFQNLDIRLSLSLAREYGLIDEKKIEAIVEELYGKSLEILDDDEKRSLIYAISHSDKQILTIDDIDTTNISSVLQDTFKRNRLASEIRRNTGNIGANVGEMQKNNDILSRIRKKNMEKVGVQEGQDYDIYEEVVSELRQSCSLSEGEYTLLRTGDVVIEFYDPESGKQYIRIDATRDENGDPLEVGPDRDYGIRASFLNISNNRLEREQRFEMTYDDLEKLFMSIKERKILSRRDFESGYISDNVEEAKSTGKIFDARKTDEPITQENIGKKLDAYDMEGSKYGFGPGTIFIASSTDENGEVTQEEVWTVGEIRGDKIDLIDGRGNNSQTKNMDLAYVFDVLSNTGGFKRIGKIHDNGELKQSLYDFGIGQEDEIKDDGIYRELMDSDGKKKKIKINCFVKDGSEHIRIGEIRDGKVIFGEFDGGDITNIHAGKEKPKYNWYQMSYGAFVQYLKANKLKASEKDIIYPDAHHTNKYDHHHPHLHGSFIKRILKCQNPASIWKGLEMFWHGIEHTLEKGAKLDAARFAMKLSKYMPFGEDIRAQVYADVVSGSKEILEKMEKKIFDLPGPRGRQKALHIAENRDSRPEEVMAAINFMLKSYGHLYAEDIKHKQSFIESRNQCISAPRGTFVFFDALVMTSNLGNLSEWRGKCYDKAKQELGGEKEGEGEPTEEQLIHALTKYVDGEWSLYPYAATVVKANGGPSSFENTYKIEGLEKAKKKGHEQTQMLNAQGRLNKAVGYADNRELKKLIGSMQAVAEKVKYPQYQAIPFIWCVGEFSSYIDSDTLQKVKSYGENGYSFHAYAFMRNHKENKIYIHAVQAVLKDIDTSLFEKFETIRKKMKPNPDNEDATRKSAEEMMKFWQKNYQVLHPILQGHNGWLIKKYNEGDPHIREYVDTLTGKHGMTLNNDSINGELAQDWYNEHGFAVNGIFSFDKETGLHSLHRTLSKIRLKGSSRVDKQLSTDDEVKLWARVKNQMNDIKDLKSYKGDTQLQKRQFMAYRREIINYFAKELQARTITLSPKEIDRIINTPHVYWKDIRNMGIDPRAIFDETLDEINAEADYERWRKGESVGKASSTGSADIQKIMERIRDGTFHTQNGRNPGKNGLQTLQYGEDSLV